MRTREEVEDMLEQEWAEYDASQKLSDEDWEQLHIKMWEPDEE